MEEKSKLTTEISETNENENEIEKGKKYYHYFLPFLNQYYYKTTYVFNNITSYKNDFLLDFILAYGILRIVNILLNNSFNNTFFFGMIIFFMYIWENWFILSHHSDLIGFPELVNWLCQIIKYGSYLLMTFCIREDVITQTKKPNNLFNFFIILIIIIRLYCLFTYMMAKPGPKYILICLPIYTLISLIPYVISFFITKSVTVKYVMWYIGVIMDIVFYLIIVFVQSRVYANLSLNNKTNNKKTKYPIFNKKNWIDRFSMLTISIIAIPIIFIPSYNFTLTFHDIVYTLICGIILISIGFIYNSVNSVLAINHALNIISPFFGSLWRMLHLPLHLGLSLVGLSLMMMIKNVYLYRNYPNNSYDETLSPRLPETYYSGLEMFYEYDKFKSKSTTDNVSINSKNKNLGKAIHSIDEIKALLSVAFLLTFISVFFMKFLHRYSTSTIIEDSIDIPNNHENKAKNSSSFTKSKDTKSSSTNPNIIKSNEYGDGLNDEILSNKNKKEEPTTSANSNNINLDKNDNKNNFNSNTNSNITLNDKSNNHHNLSKNDSSTNIDNDQLEIKKENFYKLKQNSLKTSIMDLANNKKFANPKAQDMINRCSNERIANNISEMNNNAVITTYINSSLTLYSFFIFLFQVLLILLFLLFTYIKISISLLLILTLIIVEIELLSEMLLPRLLKITNKRKNIKILPSENTKNNTTNNNDNNNNPNIINI
ncbi:hypothetical protein BCR32DRAFT_295392 [Anaeromyces robustus]|uniref:Uncharacterized protein n=1 Tax=Anaeromyces robustus TaxID=1754192 RepID=A0A1Y1WWJ6_9FUNG|nr:hypothetical protein BCR32DRAFT_295392 [Anaeromyces robustus]|eukprot:ORX77832.1 hypothetical protein BCR32DRAFT_295392 [Anaeromyces robustus]